jgi:integrase
MAYIRKQRGKWRCEVEKNGVRDSQTFETKAAAANWGAAREAEILALKRGSFPHKTLGEALTRYSEEVSEKKKGKRFEQLRLAAFARDFPKLAKKPLTELTTPDLADWRDTRLKTVTAGAVQRDLNLLSHVFTVAREEWKWMGESPLKGMRAPGQNPPRTRLPTAQEVKRICRWLGYCTGKKPTTKQEEVALAFLISLRTGMRAGEVLSLGEGNVDLKRRVATVEHKTQHLTGRPREVPLSGHAVRLLKPILAKGPIFTLTGASLDALFRKARDSLLIDGLHFHDARADALTRLAKRLGPFELARVSGHKDLRILMNVYYRDSAEEIAERLR